MSVSTDNRAVIDNTRMMTPFFKLHFRIVWWAKVLTELCFYIVNYNGGHVFDDYIRQWSSLTVFWYDNDLKIFKKKSKSDM